MLKSFLKIALVLLILLATLAVMDKLYTYGLKHNRNLKISYAQKGIINADILIHGPCEALWIISPAVLDKQTGLKSYNLALSHSDFADNYLHLYYYLQHNKAPEFMFLYVTPESMDTAYNTFNSYRFAPYLGEALTDTVVAECDPAYYRWTRLPFMRYAYYNGAINFNVVQGIRHSFSTHVLPYYPDGFEPPAKIKWDNHLEEFIKLYPEGYRFKWNSSREKYLRKTIALAQSKNIKVFLYESPVLKEALKWQPNRQEVISRIHALAKEYGVSYLVFDGMKIADSRRYFISTLNMNLEGTRLFSDSLGKYIRKNMIESKAQ